MIHNLSVAIYNPGAYIFCLTIVDLFVVFAFSASWVEMHVQSNSTKKETRWKHKSLNKCFWREEVWPFATYSFNSKQNYSAYLNMCLSFWLSPTSIISDCVFFSARLSLSHSWLSSCAFWLAGSFCCSVLLLFLTVSPAWLLLRWSLLTFCLDSLFFHYPLVDLYRLYLTLFFWLSFGWPSVYMERQTSHGQSTTIYTCTHTYAHKHSYPPV